MKKSASFALLSAFALLAAGLSSCGEVKRGEYVKGAATIYCDDGFKNILEEEIDVFEYTYPGSSIIPSYVSEARAVDALMGDSTDAIIVTHEFNKDQIKYVRDNFKKVVKQRCIAVDAVGLIVNKDNPLSELTMEELGKIMNGEINKWSQLALPDTADIQLVFDNQNSSTVLYMREKFLGGKLISENPNVHVFAQNNNREVFDVVKDNPNAIGIISVSWLGDSLENAHKVPVEKRIEGYEETDDVIAKELTTEVKVLGLQNPTAENDFTLVPYKPYQAYIETGDYPLFRKVYMITTASGSTLMKSFYDFVTGFVGQKIIANTGILPYKLTPRIVQLK
ncbi:MAG: substrate-binding domain-containing protein [Muribaculaceae bacterium]|nr:substrate-binding domain-containing protein [Muribaculaceae bacterium]